MRAKNAQIYVVWRTSIAVLTLSIIATARPAQGVVFVDDFNSPAAQQQGPRLPSLSANQPAQAPRKGVFQQQSLSRQQVAQALSAQAQQNAEESEKKPGAFNGLASGVKRLFGYGKKEADQASPNRPRQQPGYMPQQGGVTPAAYNARISRSNQTVINSQNTGNKASQQSGRSGLNIRKGDQRKGLFDLSRFGKSADEPPRSVGVSQNASKSMQRSGAMQQSTPKFVSNPNKQAAPQASRAATAGQPPRSLNVGSKTSSPSIFKKPEESNSPVFVSDMGQSTPTPKKQLPLPVVTTAPAAMPIESKPALAQVPAESPAALPSISTPAASTALNSVSSSGMPMISDMPEPKAVQPSPLVVMNPQAMGPVRQAQPAAPQRLAMTPAKQPTASAELRAGNLVLPNPVEIAESVKKQQPVQETTPRAAVLLAEAHQLARTAEVEDQYSRIVQQCRHVLAIDDSPMAVQYSNELASWAMNKRGECKADQGREEEAMTDFVEAIRMNHACWRAHHNRGVLMAQAGQFADAFDAFNKTIELNPEFAKAFSNRASLYVQAGEFQRSLADYKQAISLDPDLVVAHKGRGRVCHVLGQMEQALRHYDAAALLEPSDPTIATCRADLLVDMGRYSQAAEGYTSAISLDPADAIAHRNLAWLLATCPDNSYCDGNLALKHAQRALELTGQQDDISLDTLAAAQAAMGDFTAAVATIKQAIELAPASDQAEYTYRLELYQASKPFRCEPAGVVQAGFSTETR